MVKLNDPEEICVRIVVLVKQLSSEKGMFYLAADLHLYLNMLYKYVVH